MPEKEKKCPNCGGKVVRRPGSLTEFYCTVCRRRVDPEPDWIPKDFVEIGSAEKRKRKSKAWFRE